MARPFAQRTWLGRLALAAAVFGAAATDGSGGVNLVEGDLHVLAIGIDRYAGAPELGNLRYSVADATAVAERFRKEPPTVHVTLLADAAATGEAIRKAFATLEKSTTPASTLIVLFAGFAVDDPDHEDILLCPSDIGPKASRAISGSQLDSWLARIPASRQLVILDACVERTSRVQRIVDRMQRRAEEVAAIVHESRVVVFPGGMTSESAALGHGALTYALLRALAGEADIGPKPDGQVTARELEAALPRLYLEASRMAGMGVVPLRSSSFGDDFVVAQVPRGGDRPGAAPERTAGSGATDGPSRGLDAPGTDSDPPAAPRQDLALLLATDAYRDPSWKRLSNPILDAKAIAETLEGRFGFQTRLVENPTFETLRSVLKEYQGRKFGDDDQLLVFVAGHGAYDEVCQEGYVVSSDSGRGPVPEERALSNSQLAKAIDAIPCRHILVVLDTCYGGIFDDEPGRAGERGEGMYEDVDRAAAVRRMLKYQSRLYIASGAQPVPDGRPGSHSPFAFRFLESLRGPVNRCGVIGWHGLVDDVAGLKTPPRAGGFLSHRPGGDFVLVPLGAK